MMSRVFKGTGVAASFLALFVMLGGHWLALQSVAWTRMFVEFSRTDSLGDAIGKTFDGRHPCKMCMSIQDSRRQENRDREQSPAAPNKEAFELFCEFHPVVVPPAPTGAEAAVAFVPRWLPNFIDAPPSPPPRPAV